MANPITRTEGEDFSPSTDCHEASSSTAAVLVPPPVLMLPVPDDRRLVSTIIDETVVDLAKEAALEHRRHRFLHKMRARIYMRAHIIDLEPVRREILVKRLRETFGGVQCARWGVADRATHELLLKIASPNMIKETKYQHHRELTEAKKAGVAPSEQTYLAWVDARKKERKQKKAQQQQPPSDGGDAGDEDDSAAATAGIPVTKIEFQRLVDELAMTVPMPTEKDPVLRIQTPHQERFPEKIGVMIFIQADDRITGLTREIRQLGLVTGYDALAVAIRACLEERKAYRRTQRILYQRQADGFLRKIRADRAKREGGPEPQPEPPPYTQQQIESAADDDELDRMLIANANHGQEHEQQGFEAGDEATTSKTAGDRLAEEPTTSPDAVGAPDSMVAQGQEDDDDDNKYFARLSAAD